MRYLGVQHDKRLTFAAHVQSLVEKSVRCLYPLNNRRSRLDVANRLHPFKTMHRPTFTYGAPSLSRCARTHKKKLQVHQNRVIKMILDKPRRFSTTRLHSLAGVELIDEYFSRLSERFISSCQNNINEDIVQLVSDL